MKNLWQKFTFSSSVGDMFLENGSFFIEIQKSFSYENILEAFSGKVIFIHFFEIILPELNFD